jgi:hypothetical protein
MATEYSFEFEVTDKLLATMKNTGTHISVTKPTGKQTVSTIWISLTEHWTWFNCDRNLDN